MSNPDGASVATMNGMRMPASSGRRRRWTWCSEPEDEYGAGACGITNCCLEREP
jgi:hypothetical protein